MNKINTSDIACLPITDVQHVANEINWLRRYKEVNRKEQKRRSEYMQKYYREHRTEILYKKT